MEAGRPGKGARDLLPRHGGCRRCCRGWADLVAVVPRLGRMVARQLDDVAAIDHLGVRLDVYAGIEVPTILLGGDRSPRQLAQRLDALERVVPRAERVVLHGQAHVAHRTAPKKVAHVIEAHSDKVMASPAR